MPMWNISIKIWSMKIETDHWSGTVERLIVYMGYQFFELHTLFAILLCHSSYIKLRKGRGGYATEKMNE